MMYRIIAKNAGIHYSEEPDTEAKKPRGERVCFTSPLYFRTGHAEDSL